MRLDHELVRKILLHINASGWIHEDDVARQVFGEQADCHSQDIVLNHLRLMREGGLIANDSVDEYRFRLTFSGMDDAKLIESQDVWNETAVRIRVAVGSTSWRITMEVAAIVAKERACNSRSSD